MRGITEKRLKDLCKKYSFIGFILAECTELNVWQPIDENTPKYKPILIRFDAGEKEVGILTSEGWQSTYAEDFIESPTNWQELPKDPK